jgi:hypothetical protein
MGICANRPAFVVVKTPMSEARRAELRRAERVCDDIMAFLKENGWWTDRGIVYVGYGFADAETIGVTVHVEQRYVEECENTLRAEGFLDDAGFVSVMPLFETERWSFEPVSGA